jgi:importin subunit beta-1
MKVVCDGATQHINSTVDLQVSAYECLNRIMQLYYDKMDDYMSSLLFNVCLLSESSFCL